MTVISAAHRFASVPDVTARTVVPPRSLQPLRLQRLQRLPWLRLPRWWPASRRRIAGLEAQLVVLLGLDAPAGGCYA